MRVLYISTIRDNSGWSRAAADQILALDSAGVDVVVRCVKFTSRTPGEIPPRILELEKRSAVGCDVVIQNVLPSFMERAGNARHIAYYFAEADRLPDGWADNINLLDESWVPNAGAVDTERNSGVDHPTFVIPCSTDVSRYQKSYKPHQLRREMPDRFFFYTIGEGHRKNLPALVRAFHLAFRPEEAVELIIKTSIPGRGPLEAKRIVEGVLSQIKHDIGLYPSEAHYKKEIIITEHLNDHEIMRLHATCDCFVSAAYGEGWGLPIFSAMAMGKTPIYTSVSGHNAFLDASRGYPVGGQIEPVFGINDGFYDARQNWLSVDIPELARRMREVYEMRNSSERKTLTQNGMASAYNYSYKAVGQIMARALEQGGGV